MTAFERVAQQLKEARIAHERAVNEAIRRFEEMSPEEQRFQQLRTWQYFITGVP